VPGGAAVELAVQFDPRAAGAAAATLALEADGVAFAVPLEGLGALAPSCTPSADCVEVSFDPASGCVERPAADGTACGAFDRCVADGRCLQGACVGEPVSCGDRDACTADACSPAQGCLHVPVACPPPADPCQVATCDPLAGCGAQPAPDGTSCGDNDCQTAHVCIAGACVARPAPDGSRCAPATSCRAAGTCDHGACALPPVQVPAPRWRFTPPADMNLMRVEVDPRGNTYALLGSDLVYQADAGPPPYSLWLESFDRDGQPRFSVNLTQRTPGLENGVALMVDPDADRVYLAARTYNYGTATPRRAVVAQARSASTGALLWEHDLHQGIPVLNSSSGEMWLDVTRTILLDGGDVALALIEGESLHQSYVVALSAADGAELWRVARSGHLGGGATGNGEVWEDSAACWSSDAYVSRISGGVSGPRQPFRGGFLAFDRDRALAWTYETSELVWLSPGFAQTPVALPAGHSFAWGGLARLEGSQLTLVTNDASQRPTLDRLDATTGALQWSAPLGPASGYQTWLLRDGGTATDLSYNDGGTELVTHSAAGVELERCPYGGARGVAVTNGLYVTQDRGGIAVFDLPGREPATSGWTGPNGYAGTGRAR